MRRNILGMALTILVLSGCLHPPLLWSPDGRWLAYTVGILPRDRLVAPGWLLDPQPESVRKSSKTGPSFDRYRLWASRPETGESVLLVDSIDPISSPTWSHDGKSLAVSRVVAEAEGRKRLETVLIAGPGRERVLTSEPIDPFRVELSRLPDIAPAWSPDGALIAVPRGQPIGLAIIRIDTGRVVKTIDDAYLPSWSPDGARLAFIRRGETETLGFIEPRTGGPRYLHDVGQSDQAPVWTRDGQSLLVAARPSRGKLGEVIPAKEEVLLLRISVETGQVEPLRPLSGERAMPGEAPVSGVAYSMDRDGENLFYSVGRPNAPSQVTWYRPRESFIFRKFPVIDYTIPIGAISAAPEGKTVAARVGPINHLLPPALYDLEKNLSSVIAPDDDARLEWITLLGGTASGLLRNYRSAQVNARKGSMDHPSPLPFPGELDENSEVSHRLRRIAKIGRAACQRTEGSDPPSAPLNEVFDEARLFFEYLSGDYPAAQESLERLESRDGSARRNLNLLGLRAQIALASADFERFDAALELLGKVESRSRVVLEEVGGVTRMIEQAPDRVGWAASLEAARREIDEEEGEPEREEFPIQSPLNRTLPDLARPGQGAGLPPSPPVLLPNPPFPR